MSYVYENKQFIVATPPGHNRHLNRIVATPPGHYKYIIYIYLGLSVQLCKYEGGGLENDISKLSVYLSFIDLWGRSSSVFLHPQNPPFANTCRGSSLSLWEKLFPLLAIYGYTMK